MTIIPVSADLRQAFDVRLPGGIARLLVWWQPAPDAHWYCSFEFPVGTTRALGRRVLPAAPLLPRRFSPNLYCEALDPAHAGHAPGREAWGHSHRLVWR